MAFAPKMTAKQQQQMQELEMEMMQDMYNRSDIPIIPPFLLLPSIPWLLEFYTKPYSFTLDPLSLPLFYIICTVQLT